MGTSDFVNGFHVFRGALDFKVRRTRVPLMVSLGLTDRCNLECPFCYAFITQDPDPELDVMLNYVDQFCDLGTRIFLLQGGEPTMYKHVGKVIAHIKARRRYCRMSTNGVLVARKIDALAGLDQISFSLDGNDEVVAQTRGKGVYAQVVAGMEAAFERRIPFEIHASLIRVSASNEPSLMHLFELADRFHTEVSFCVTCVSGAENTQSVGTGEMTKEEVREVYLRLMDYKRKGFPVSNTLNSLDKSVHWPLGYGEIGFPDRLAGQKDVVECRHGRLICWLDASGILYPCPTAFGRPEFAVKVENRDIAAAWEALGSKMTCMACGGSDESTTLFALKMEDLLENFGRLVKHNFPKR